MILVWCRTVAAAAQHTNNNCQLSLHIWCIAYKNVGHFYQHYCSTTLKNSRVFSYMEMVHDDQAVVVMLVQIPDPEHLANLDGFQT